MRSSKGEKLIVAVLTFLTAGSVVTLSYFFLTADTSYPNPEADRTQAHQPDR